jgi:hypothetical protein
LTLGTKVEKEDPHEKFRYARIHISFLSRDLTPVVTEKIIREVFTEFGTVQDVTIKKYIALHVSLYDQSSISMYSSL